MELLYPGDGRFSARVVWDGHSDIAYCPPYFDRDDLGGNEDAIQSRAKEASNQHALRIVEAVNGTREYGQPLGAGLVLKALRDLTESDMLACELTDAQEAAGQPPLTCEESGSGLYCPLCFALLALAVADGVEPVPQ